MDFITSPPAITEWSAQTRKRSGTVGFVPTMGALHTGHLDLISQAKKVCDQVVCSIFVNPLQFNDPEDLKKYPRRLNEDRVLLEKAGCNALFAPDKESIFADFDPFTYDLGGLVRNWEGPSRPGHFQGVVNVVERLFHYVRPDQAFFGEKDRQQLTILRHVGQAYRWPEKIIPCPTVRAKDGLALSSRNARLDPAERQNAVTLYLALQKASEVAFRSSVAHTHDAAMAVLLSCKEITVDYLGIADLDTLEPLTDWEDRTEALMLVAAQVGPVRLIDNVTLHRPCS